MKRCFNAKHLLLKLRRLATDLVNAHKVINHLNNSNLEHLFDLHLSNTHGYAYKVRKQHSSHDFWKHFFTLRVAEAWNKLPASVVGCLKHCIFQSLHASCSPPTLYLHPHTYMYIIAVRYSCSRLQYIILCTKQDFNELWCS